MRKENQRGRPVSRVVAREGWDGEAGACGLAKRTETGTATEKQEDEVRQRLVGGVGSHRARGGLRYGRNVHERESRSCTLAA